MTCIAKTKKNKQCKNRASGRFCHIHQKQAESRRLIALRVTAKNGKNASIAPVPSAVRESRALITAVRMFRKTRQRLLAAIQRASRTPVFSS